MSAVLVQALSPAVMLEKLPKCVISIYVVVLENDGSELSAAITCASLALADAAIEMYDLVAASSAVSIDDYE
jgi:exosome complex component MTR3